MFLVLLLLKIIEKYRNIYIVKRSKLKELNEYLLYKRILDLLAADETMMQNVLINKALIVTIAFPSCISVQMLIFHLLLKVLKHYDNNIL